MTTGHIRILYVEDDEYLGFVFQSSEGCRVNDPVAVALISIAVGRVRLFVASAQGFSIITCV